MIHSNFVSHHYPVIEACSLQNSRHATDERSSIKLSAQKANLIPKPVIKYFFSTSCMMFPTVRTHQPKLLGRFYMRRITKYWTEREKVLFAETNNNRKANPWWFLLNKKSKAEEREFLCRQNEKRRSRFKMKINKNFKNFFLFDCKRHVVTFRLDIHFIYCASATVFFL